MSAVLESLQTLSVAAPLPSIEGVASLNHVTNGIGCLDRIF